MAKFQNSINQASFGTDNTVFGSLATELGTVTGDRNAIFGFRAARNLSSGSFNTLIGAQAGWTITTQSENTCIGFNAGSQSTPTACTFVGHSAGLWSSGTDNVGVGRSAVGHNTGSQNIGIGQAACNWGSGINNTAVGHGAASNMSTATLNVAVGYHAMLFGSTASNNCIIGYRSFAAGTFTGNNNVAVGYQTGVVGTSAANNTLIGYSCGSALTSGGYNLCLGYNSGTVPTTESSNIYLMHVGAAEANTIRIGTQGTGNGQQNRAFMAGIAGTTLASPVGSVLVDANGQLGQGSAANVFNWVEVTGTSQNAAVGTGYIANNVAMVTVTLPSTFAFGDVIEVGGKGAGLFTVTANTGDTISIVGPTAAGYTTSAGGSLVGNDQYGHLRLIAITANSAWIAIPTGNFTVT